MTVPNKPGPCRVGRLTRLLCLSGLAAAVGWVTLPVRAEADTVVWALVDRPPMMILRDGRAPTSVAELGAGSADQGLAAVIRRLPGYRHAFVLRNGSSIWVDMERGNNLCYFAALKTEPRLAFATFTPYRVVPPQVIVVHKDRREALFGSATKASLREVVASAGAEGRLEKARSYGPELDAILADKPLARESVTATSALLKPLARGHFGFTIEYPQTVQYMVDNGWIANSLELIEVQEASTWPESFVACTRNAWGQKVIQDIDRAIREESVRREYRAAVTNWTPPRLLRANRTEVEKFFDERARGGPRIY